MKITPLYAAVLAIIYIILSLRIIKLRRENKVAIGHGNHKLLERAQRAHANFAEYVPLALILIYMYEAIAGTALLVHGACLSLLTGRIVHAYNISRLNESIGLRVFGMLLTFAALGFAAISIIISYIGSQTHSP